MRAEGSMSFAPVSEINVTPLVDVTLVLLVIFMVAAPLLEQGVEVNLPKAGTGQELTGSSPIITLTKYHALYYNGTEVTLGQLRQTLAGLDKDRSILIRSDREARVEKLVELWDLCRGAGLSRVRITTLPAE
ncbi:MAG: biopolymer transporter ExbD [Candidatus Omnitrophica bacterium]|nr:biopolymer transporter ExbD [Candidatus Omnitrophota bacterium]